jgi:hypothetical protein
VNEPFGITAARRMTPEELRAAADQPGKTDPFDGSWGDQTQDVDNQPVEPV